MRVSAKYKQHRIIWWSRFFPAHVCLCVRSSEALWISYWKRVCVIIFLTFIYPQGVCSSTVLYIHTVIKKMTHCPLVWTFCGLQTPHQPPAWYSVLRQLTNEYLTAEWWSRWFVKYFSQIWKCFFLNVTNTNYFDLLPTSGRWIFSRRSECNHHPWSNLIVWV